MCDYGTAAANVPPVRSMALKMEPGVPHVFPAFSATRIFSPVSALQKIGAPDSPPQGAPSPDRQTLLEVLGLELMAKKALLN